MCRDFVPCDNGWQIIGSEMTRKPNYSKLETTCGFEKDVQMIQPFPNAGMLKENLNFSLAKLQAKLAFSSEIAYSYVVRSVKLNPEQIRFEQHGSGPNFQGTQLTLCTCKHQMRASQSPDKWAGTWVAGFTGITIHENKNWLFYLSKIESAFESHFELWDDLSPETREAKAAHLHYLGDTFMPKKPMQVGDSRFLPSRYQKPSNHSHQNERNRDGWKNDINYVKVEKYGQPSMLVGDPKWTFIWETPIIYFPGKHCRNYKKWYSIAELLGQL